MVRHTLIFLSWLLSLGSDEGLCRVCLRDPNRGHRAECPYAGHHREEDSNRAQMRLPDQPSATGPRIFRAAGAARSGPSGSGCSAGTTRARARPSTSTASPACR
jgi:hypothetical protein